MSEIKNFITPDQYRIFTLTAYNRWDNTSKMLAAKLEVCEVKEDRDVLLSYSDITINRISLLNAEYKRCTFYLDQNHTVIELHPTLANEFYTSWYDNKMAEYTYN